jgi:hypothetical protein
MQQAKRGWIEKASDRRADDKIVRATGYNIALAGSL